MSRVQSPTEQSRAVAGASSDTVVAALEACFHDAAAETLSFARDALKTQFWRISPTISARRSPDHPRRNSTRRHLGDLPPRQMESVRGIINGGRQLLSRRRDFGVAANQLALVPSVFVLRDVWSR